LFLEGENPVGLHRQADEVGRADEMLVLAELGDPTGLRASLSNVDRDLRLGALLEEGREGRDANPLDICRDSLAEKLGRVAGEDDDRLHAGRRGAVGGDVEGDAGAGGIGGSRTGDDGKLWHEGHDQAISARRQVGMMVRKVATVEVEDSVSTPVAPSPERLRDFYFAATERLTLGLVRYIDNEFRLGPLTLIRLGEPDRTAHGWSFPIRGGVLAAEPGGELRISSDEGRTTVALAGYRPSLPLPIYRATQYLFHHFISRLALLQLRGRIPAEAPPATPAARLAAGAIDAAVCLALADGRRRRTLLVAVAYHAACWSFGGLTAGGLLLGLRVVAVDGRPVTPGQALLRLATLPLSLLRLRAVHDEIAGTDVVRP
jgi:RDD family